MNNIFRFLNPIFLICICCTISCSINNTPTPIDPAKASIHVSEEDSILTWPQTYNLSTESFLSQEIDSITIIRLSEKEELSIGQISQIQHHNDTLIVADNYHIFLYSAQGDFISSIGAQGHGPNEYINFGGMFASKDSIYIKDRGKGCILTYSFNGENTTIRNFKKGAPQVFCILSNGVTLGAYSGYRKNSLYRLIIFDSKLKNEETAFPYTEPQEYVAGNFFNINDTTALFSFPLCDTVFKVSDKKITPEIIMNIHEKKNVSNFISETSTKSQPDFVQKLYNTENIVNTLEIYSFDSGWLLYYQKSDGAYYSFIQNKKRTDYIHSDLKKKILHYPFIIHSIKNNWIYGYIDFAALSYLEPDSRTAWIDLIKKNSLKPLSDEDIENAVPAIIKMHIRK